MPNNKKSKSNSSRRAGAVAKRELNLKEDGGEQVYAQITKVLGHCRLEAYCFDGSTRQCLIRGSLRRRPRSRMGLGDIILVSLRDYQDSKCDVIYKYNADEARQLKGMGQLPESAKVNQSDMMIGAELGDSEIESHIEFIDSI